MVPNSFSSLSLFDLLTITVSTKQIWFPSKNWWLCVCMHWPQLTPSIQTLWIHFIQVRTFPPSPPSRPSPIHYLIININYSKVNFKCITYQFYQDCFWIERTKKNYITINLKFSQLKRYTKQLLDFDEWFLMFKNGSVFFFRQKTACSSCEWSNTFTDQ